MRFGLDLQFSAPDPVTAEAVAQRLTEYLEQIKADPSAPPPRLISDGLTVVYTDGGCSLNRNGIGAWAYTAKDPDGAIKEDVGVFLGTTNNRMEMMAVLQALQAIPIGSPIVLFSDSEYVVKGLTQWSANWVRNGWRTKDGKDVANRDLWEPLVALYKLHDVAMKWVKGHAGDPLNERVDEMCTAAMAKAYKQHLDGADLPYDER